MFQKKWRQKSDEEYADFVRGVGLVSSNERTANMKWFILSWLGWCKATELEYHKSTNILRTWSTIFSIWKRQGIA